MNNNKEDAKITKTKLEDAKQICLLIDKYSKERLMFYRPVSEIEYKIRDYFVCRPGNEVVGCVAFRIWNKKAQKFMLWLLTLIVREKELVVS